MFVVVSQRLHQFFTCSQGTLVPSRVYDDRPFTMAGLNFTFLLVDHTNIYDDLPWSPELRSRLCDVARGYVTVELSRVGLLFGVSSHLDIM